MIKIIRGDITKQTTDAIVNATNESLLNGSGVCGAILRAAGAALLVECGLLNGCNTGYAKITKGYQLSAKYVVHTPEPRWHGGDSNEKELLANCYRNSLFLADKHSCTSISFPPISTGVGRFSLPESAKIAIATIYSTVKECVNIKEVVFVCFDEVSEAYYKKAVDEHTNCEPRKLRPLRSFCDFLDED